MKRVLLTIALCVAASSVSFAQKKAVKEARSIAKSSNADFNEARTLIKGALENAETKDQAETLIKSSVEFEELVKAGKLIQAGYGDQQTIIRAQYLVNSIAQELSLIYGINPTMAAAAIISNAGIPITQ